MSKLLKYLEKKDWLFIIIILGLVVFQVVMDLSLPEYTSSLTTVVSSGQATMDDVWANGGKMLLCAGASMIASIIAGYFAARVAANFSKNIRTGIFVAVERFSIEEMNHFSPASLITRTTNDVVQIQTVVAMGLQVLIKAPILAVYAISKIYSSDIIWTQTVVIAVAIMLTIICTILVFTYSKFKQIQKLTDELNGITRENVSGVRVIRAFNAETYQQSKFEKINEKVTKNNLYTGTATGIIMPILQAIMSGLTLAIYLVGAYLMQNAQISKRVDLLGEMTAFSQYALQIVMAFLMLVVIFAILPRAIVAGKRIREVIDTKITILDGQEVDGTNELCGEIEFQGVSFAYPNAKSETLSDISFKVSKGETLAIIGGTGSGKTSLVQLIPRFFDTSKGQILFNGRNVKEYTQEALRERIGYVTQKAVLFQGTIEDNICYGSKNPLDQQRLEQALVISNAKEFVSKLSNGVKSAVSQGGTNFSGGQKQRLSIARAIYKKPEVLIFDDSFSALDYKTDQFVRREIKQNAKDSTVIIVAQRISTIMQADKIIVLEDGKIAGLGSHQELLNTCEVYQSIAKSQLSEEELKNEEV